MEKSDYHPFQGMIFNILEVRLLDFLVKTLSVILPKLQWDQQTQPDWRVQMVLHFLVTQVSFIIHSTWISLILGLSSGPRMLIALYDYNSREISDMSFRKGDRMELLDDRFVRLLILLFVYIRIFTIRIMIAILIGGKLSILLLTKLDTFHETLLPWSSRSKAMSKWTKKFSSSFNK